MNSKSKELLEILEDNGTNYLLPVRGFRFIKQDLERLEQLENENPKLKQAIKILKEYIMYEELDEILEKYPDLKEVFESVGE